MDSSNSFLILYTVLRLTPKHCEICKTAGRNAQQYTGSFPKSEGVNRHGVDSFTDSVQLTLVGCRVNKTWNKESAHTKWIIQNGDNLPIIYMYRYIIYFISLSLSLYIYVYTCFLDSILREREEFINYWGCFTHMHYSKS